MRNQSGNWQQSPGGRVVIGVLLALGLCYGLLQLCAAGFMVLGRGTPDGGVSGVIRLVLFEGLQALALLAGGALAGAGQRRGAGLGAIVGVMSGLLLITAMLDGVFAILDQSFVRDLLTPGTALRNITLYGLPILHAVCGALGGLVGSKVWKPLFELDLAAAVVAQASSVPGMIVRAVRRSELTKFSKWSWTGSVAWGRVVVGTVVALCGAIWTQWILGLLILACEGKLKIMTSFEDQVSYGEVFSLSILVGGCIAGTNTFNGLRQGVYVGLCAAVALTIFFISGLLKQSVPAIYPVLSTLFLGPIGGWFGSELLPPIYKAPPHPRTRRWF
jgi:hypothetical protein